jgi:hypothetical protein
MVWRQAKEWCTSARCVFIRYYDLHRYRVLIDSIVDENDEGRSVMLGEQCKFGGKKSV